MGCVVEDNDLPNVRTLRWLGGPIGPLSQSVIGVSHRRCCVIELIPSEAIGIGRQDIELMNQHYGEVPWLTNCSALIV